MVELEEKGNVQIKLFLSLPLRDMRKIRGTYMEVTDRAFMREPISRIISR